MDRSESIKEITAAIAKVQGELKPIAKDRDNPISHSKYANLDSINQELLPLTSKNGLAVMQYPVTKDNKIGCGTIVTHTSGEYLHFEPYLITVAENKRMSVAQEGGATITYAKRYQISAIFGIVTDEDQDGAQPEPQPTGNNSGNSQGYQKQGQSNKARNQSNNHSKSGISTGASGILNNASKIIQKISSKTGEIEPDIYQRIKGQVGFDDSELNEVSNAAKFFNEVQNQWRALEGNK
ncbi:ERF family protein [Loigolactobacillus coryniformis]|uniref:ERF family protein n=1 Tax=Loigolactobacillus coryniformis TaxID=1610 RepID=UPI001C5F90A3|nr:ERF family protein [Loigolactobacillus coryniformis]MBW4803771.1 ERF family protein [Loigolactobacillus coryniformis subsp. torquens]MBW4806473.1 ERF family protein [Loigolactobacillus coryniformis subsp. torquens]